MTNERLARARFSSFRQNSLVSEIFWRDAKMDRRDAGATERPPTRSSDGSAEPRPTVSKGGMERKGRKGAVSTGARFLWRPRGCGNYLGDEIWRVVPVGGARRGGRVDGRFDCAHHPWLATRGQ